MQSFGIGNRLRQFGREGLLGVAWQVDAARVAAIAAGLTPLAVQQPAHAYDSVVAMLQSASIESYGPSARLL